MSELGEGRHACAGLDHALLGLSSYPPAGGARILTRAVEEALRAWALLLTLEAAESNPKQDPTWEQQVLGSCGPAALLTPPSTSTTSPTFIHQHFLF